MNAHFSLQDATVCIVGLGLMGGSLALALKGHCQAVVGSDVDAQTVEEACRRGIVDRADQDSAQMLGGADVVILAIPVFAIVHMLDVLPDVATRACVVMDIGSVKRSITDKMNELPDRFEPVGGHPLCGKEKLSLANAEASLYQGAPFFLTPIERTTQRALSAAHQITEAIGARAMVIDAAEHDRGLAMSSHLPFLLSSALSLTTPLELSRFVGPGFRSTTRLAGTPASMMTSVLQSNRDNVLEAVHGLQSELSRIEKALSEGEETGLDEILNEARSKYEALVG